MYKHSNATLVAAIIATRDAVAYMNSLCVVLTIDRSSRRLLSLVGINSTIRLLDVAASQRSTSSALERADNGSDGDDTCDDDTPQIMGKDKQEMPGTGTGTGSGEGSGAAPPIAGGAFHLPQGLSQYELRAPSDEKDITAYAFLLKVSRTCNSAHS